MADATAKKLVALLGPEHPLPLRCAAARVLAEVGEPAPGLTEALLAALDDPEAELRAAALAAIGKLTIDTALPRLLEKVEAAGPESELAARAAAQLGSKGTKALRSVMGRVAPGLRQRIAGALGTGATSSAEAAALETLLDPDPRVVDAATRSLVARIPSFSKEHRRALVGRVLEILDAAESVSVGSESALLRLLAALGDDRAAEVFWQRLAPDRPAEIRAAALQGLRGVPADRRHLRLVVSCACDPDFRIAAPALMALKNVDAERGNVKEWLPLLDAADPAVRRFAVERLGRVDQRDVASALLRQLEHPDAALRKEAIAALAGLEGGRRLLIEALLAAGTPDETWSLARVQAPFAHDFPSALRKSLFERAGEYLEAGDRRADPLLFLLRDADARELRDRIEDKALALRKQKRYPGALLYLNLLTRDPACGDAVRFEAAGCALKLSAHDLAAEARTHDPALQQLARMLNHGSDVATLLLKAKWLDADDLFYVGFHFAEGNRPEKEAAARLLNDVIRRSPRSQRARDARNKLRSQGLA